MALPALRPACVSGSNSLLLNSSRYSAPTAIANGPAGMSKTSPLTFAPNTRCEVNVASELGAWM